MIQVEDLTKTYGDTRALQSIAFSIPAGQVCGYLGPNGAGKSTTVRILTGVAPPDTGRAVVAGFDVLDQPLEVKRRIGYVPETAAAYPTLSVEEFLTLAGSLHRMAPKEIAARIRRMLELFGIQQAAQQRIGGLSKGMKQKMVISAALLHDPEVLLLDEPLSGLDANAVRTIKDLIRKLADRGKTILYCSHMLDVVERLCERVIILDHGKIVAAFSLTARCLAGKIKTQRIRKLCPKQHTITITRFVQTVAAIGRAIRGSLRIVPSVGSYCRDRMVDSCACARRSYEGAIA